MMELVNSHFTDSFVFSISNINSSIFLFFFSSSEDEVPLSQLMGSNLLWQLTVSEISCYLVTLLMKVEIDTVAIAFVLFGNRNNHDLSWRQEQWPFAVEMLNQDSHEPLNRSEDSSMDHHWS